MGSQCDLLPPPASNAGLAVRRHSSGSCVLHLLQCAALGAGGARAAAGGRRRGLQQRLGVIRQQPAQTAAVDSIAATYQLFDYAALPFCLTLGRLSHVRHFAPHLSLPPLPPPPLAALEAPRQAQHSESSPNCADAA